MVEAETSLHVEEPLAAGVVLEQFAPVERVSVPVRRQRGDGVPALRALVAEVDGLHTLVGEPLPTTARLTPAQRTVLVALCRPYKDERPYATPSTNQQIADELSLSLDAVKTHLRTLFHKFGIDHLPQNQKRARLVEMALQHGLVSTRNL